MALVDYDNDILSKIETSEYLIPSYEEDIRELTSQISIAKDSKIKSELTRQLNQIKKSLEIEKSNLKEYRKARKDISNHIITLYKNSRDRKEKINNSINKLHVDIKTAENILEASDIAPSKQLELTKLLDDKRRELKKREVELVYADDSIRRAYTKVQVAANLRDGWNSFIKTGGLIWKDYVSSLRLTSFRAEDSKLAYTKIIAAETFRFIGTYAITAIKTFYKTSEEIFKSTVKGWGESIKNTFAPFFKPFMFVIGGMGLFLKGFSNFSRFIFEKKSNRVEDGELKKEADNPFLKYTRWLPDMSATLDDILLNIGLGVEIQRMSEISRRKYEETQVNMLRRKELADARKIPDKPKKDSIGLMTLFGLGAFAVAYITTRIKELVIGLKLLGAPFKLLGSAMSWLSGKNGVVTKGVKIVGSIFNIIGNTFKFIGSLFKPIALFFSKATLLLRFTAPFMKFIPVIGQIAAIGMALWDFIKGWNSIEGNWYTKFINAVWAVMNGILEWPLKLLDKVLDLFKIKPENGTLAMIKKFFFWLYGFGWLKDLIKVLPDWLLPDKVKAWAGGSDTKKETNTENLNDAIADKNDSQKDSRKIQESNDIKAQEKLISEIAKGYTNPNSSSSSAIAMGGSSSNKQGNSQTENKIRDRISPELTWAAFAATR